MLFVTFRTDAELVEYYKAQVAALPRKQREQTLKFLAMVHEAMKPAESSEKDPLGSCGGEKEQDKK